MYNITWPCHKHGCSWRISPVWPVLKSSHFAKTIQGPSTSWLMCLTLSCCHNPGGFAACVVYFDVNEESADRLVFVCTLSRQRQLNPRLSSRNMSAQSCTKEATNSCCGCEWTEWAESLHQRSSQVIWTTTSHCRNKTIWKLTSLLSSLTN